MNGLLSTVGQASYGLLDFYLQFSAVDFFNHLNMLYGTVTEFCIPSEVCRFNLMRLVVHKSDNAPQCPIMSAGPRFVIISG